MSRFLFVVPPMAGHVNPAVGVAAALVARGHQVAWAAAAEIIGPRVGSAATVFPCAMPPPPTMVRPADVRGFAALKFLWERVLVPLAETMEPGVRAAVDEFAPDVVVVDQQAIAGALVANRLGLRWASSVTTSSELTDPLAGLPRVDEWLRATMRDLQCRFSDPRVGEDLRFSPHLVLAFTTEALFGTPGLLGERVRFVGPALSGHAQEIDFPWASLDAQRQLVVVTLGTVNAEAGTRFLTECVSALLARSDRVQAVVADPTGTVPGVPPHVIVRPRLPQLPLLARAHAVVCHAGHNTVCEALYHGVPLVVAPIRDDQPIVADQVVRAGAGIRLRFTRATASHVGAAVDAVLTEPAYRQGARQVRESFRAAGGAAAAAQHLERLAPAGSLPQPGHGS